MEQQCWRFMISSRRMLRLGSSVLCQTDVHTPNSSNIHEHACPYSHPLIDTPIFDFLFFVETTPIGSLCFQNTTVKSFD